MEQNRNIGESNTEQLIEPIPQSDMREGILLKKLKHMCARPKRRIVKFLDNSTDMSLFTFLRKMTNTLTKECREEGCSKPLLSHTRYLYHANGCVLIKAGKTILEPTMAQQ